MKTFMIGGAAAVAMTAFFVSFAMDSETPEYIAPLPTGEYEIGKVYSFDRPNAIDLETDRYNDSVKLFFDLPPGFVVESADLIVTKRKHTVKYGATFTQAKSVSIDQAVLIDLDSSIDKAHGLLDGKKRVEALASLTDASNKLKYSSVIKAGSHARVNWYGWADGRRYSSKDGVIRADLKVLARYLGTSAEIETELVRLAEVIGKANAEMIGAASANLSKQTVETSIEGAIPKKQGKQIDAPAAKALDGGATQAGAGMS